jgi:hypothetical protein
MAFSYPKDIVATKSLARRSRKQSELEEGTGYFFDHRSWGTGSFLKYKKQPVPDKGRRKSCLSPFRVQIACRGLTLTREKRFARAQRPMPPTVSVRLVSFFSLLMATSIVLPSLL